MKRNQLHPVMYRMGIAEPEPLAGLDVRRSDGLCALEEWLRIFRRCGGEIRRQPKVTLSLRDEDIGVGKDPLPILSGEAADVIGVKVRNQNAVDLFRRVACATQAVHQTT